MLCPYCHLEYTDERPCFCQPPAKTKQDEPESELRARAAESIAWNSQRGVRLD